MVEIAIAGAGIAGGYLAGLFRQRGISPDLYDGMQHETACGCRSCGWGAPRGIEPHLSRVGLDLDDYLIRPMQSMNFDGLLAKTPLCTIDKPRLIRDLTRDCRLERRNLMPAEAEGYDVVVDSTGIARAFLPPCRSDLTLPTLQHRVTVEARGSGSLAAGVHGNRIPGLGYLWIFPLHRNQYHIGIGGIGLDSHDSLMEGFYRDLSGKFSFTPLCSCRGVVRVASPYYSTPFHVEKNRKDGTSQSIVGIGESIGTVSPFTGEGIVYSLQSAEILADSWPDFGKYAKTVLARFGWMRKERETLEFLLSQGKSGSPRLRDRWRFFQNARRSGIELPMIEAFRRMGSLSRWVEGPKKGV